jgi:hypothetical protein
VDSAQVRHLRNHSSYLLPTTLLSRISLGGLLVSGVLTTTLLAMAIPVSFALLVRIFARFGAFDAQHPLDAFGYYWQPFALLGTVAATVALLCWLLRPITAVWRNAHRSVDVVATVGCLGAAAAFALAATPWLLDLVTRFAHWRLASVSITGATILASGAFTVKAVKVLWPYRRLISRIFIASGVVLFAVVYLATIQYLGLTPGESSWTTPEIVVCSALAVWVLWAAALNLNLTGLHRYYRDGLASCYLQSPEPPREGLAHPPPLEALSADLPYHLINTTVNLAASPNAELRGRGGDFFLLSKFYCGSPIAGYQSTRTVHAMNPDLDLATAVAISGAAASANMGWQTMREYRVLMAIFNVRLGYWLRWRKGSHGWLASNAFTQLTREMLGLLREEASSLNLSDGGHIENLAAYELIRRKMKFIVCVDGGMDGEMTCADLNRLQRLALIDFGYRLEFDDSDLRLTDGFSTNYGILVKIDYTPDQPDVERKQLGWMLYMKLAMLGTEPNYVLDYRREQPLFPHQSTMDQFFDESQFEAYRKLGECAAKNFLSDEFGTRGVCGFEEWFANLAQSLLRDTDEVYLRDDAARNDPDIGDGLERARTRATRRPVPADGPGN